ncbi:MAG: hypothetical protein IKG27_01880 [Bacilli bacterium]|nr:hypothetical protein [Bacilli bacterium]
MELTFLEKMCLKYLEGMTERQIDSDILINFCMNTLFKNRTKIIKFLIEGLKSDNDSEEYFKASSLLEAVASHDPDFYNDFVTDYLKDNLDDIALFEQEFFEPSLYLTLFKKNFINDNNIEQLLDYLLTRNSIWIIAMNIDDIEDEEFKKRIVLLLSSKMCEKIKQSTFSDEDKELIINSINQTTNRHLKQNNINITFMTALTSAIGKPTQIISMAKLGNISLSVLSLQQIKNINVKEVRRLQKLANNMEYEEGHDYSEEEMADSIATLYVVFGKQRTQELLEGKYGKFSKNDLFNLFSLCTVNEDYVVTNTGPVHNDVQKALVNFLFGSGINNPNANIRKILSGQISNEDLSMEKLINEWKLYYELLGGQITIEAIIEQMKDMTVILPPQAKELEFLIKLKNFPLSDVNDAITTFLEMKKRDRSSIPKITGKADEYEYEMLDITDSMQMAVGYITYCCFTFGGESEDSLKHACTNEDSRIFVIKKDGKIVAQSWVWRRGNTVCFDNIETAGVSRLEDNKLFKIYEQAADQIISVSKENENNNEKIELVTVGKGNSDINLRFKKILDKNEQFLPKDLYTDAKTQIILGTSDDYTKPRDFKVNAIYKDARKPMKLLDPQQTTKNEIEEANNLLNRITFMVDGKDSFEKIDIEDYTLIIYGQDWFIGILTDGNIVKKTLNEEDSREEIAQALEILKKNIKSGELEENLLDTLPTQDIGEDSYGTR